MKLIVLCLAMLSMKLSFASEFKCQVILNGENTYPDNLIIPNTATKEECIKKAKELFKKNKETYNKLFILLESKTIEVDVDEV